MIGQDIIIPPVLVKLEDNRRLFRLTEVARAAHLDVDMMKEAMAGQRTLPFYQVEALEVVMQGATLKPHKPVVSKFQAFVLKIIGYDY